MTLSAIITHNDSASTAACLTLTAMLWQLLHMADRPAPDWWLDTYTAVASDLETGRIYVPRSPHVTAYAGPAWLFTRKVIEEARARRLSTVEACDWWYSGAYVLETVPSALYILMHAGDGVARDGFADGVIRAVNDTKDNDTVAAIVGAALGALYGKRGIPEQWLSRLLGRTTDSDDGMIFDLLRQARARWGPETSDG